MISATPALAPVAPCGRKPSSLPPHASRPASAQAPNAVRKPIVMARSLSRWWPALVSLRWRQLADVRAQRGDDLGLAHEVRVARHRGAAPHGCAAVLHDLFDVRVADGALPLDVAKVARRRREPGRGGAVAGALRAVTGHTAGGEDLLRLGARVGRGRAR